MRVAVDCHMVGQPAAGDAGNARFSALLANTLAATGGAGDSVVALTAYAPAGAALNPAVSHVEVPSGNLRRLAFDARRALRRSRIEAAVFTYVMPLSSPCPVVLAVHDVAFKLFPDWFSPRVRIVLGQLVPRSIGRAARVLTISERSKADIVDAFGVPDEKIAVVAPVPAPVFTPRPDAAAGVHARFGLDRYCLVVGDVHPRKNLGALVEAMRRLGDPNLELAIVGRPGHRGAAIIAQARARWLGPVTDDDLAELYSAAAITCYPSLYEGFGLPVVEAMACGSPVVASCRGAIPEVAGDAALLVEPTPDAIAAGLRAALEPQTAERLRTAGPIRAARFSAPAMGEAAWHVLRGTV